MNDVASDGFIGGVAGDYVDVDVGGDGVVVTTVLVITMHLVIQAEKFTCKDGDLFGSCCCSRCCGGIVVASHGVGGRGAAGARGTVMVLVKTVVVEVVVVEIVAGEWMS